MEIIATFHGCFPDKFGVPRQAGLVQEAKGVIQLLGRYRHENYIQGLHLYSHLWIIFQFHKNPPKTSAMVRPQRLGGNQRLGVFATRSSFCPNQLGLSAVKIERIDYAQVAIHVSGHDLVDGTPIISLKPYIPFSDAIGTAISDFAGEPPERYPVVFSEKAQKILTTLVQYPNLEGLIVAVIAQDPTPRFHHDPERIYGIRLYQWDILFKKNEGELIVMDIL